MPFNFGNFMNEVRADNPHYERFKTSSLHALVQALNPVPPALPVLDQLIRQIPLAKWQKYSRTKLYLLLEINGLAAQLNGYFGVPVAFQTISLTPQAGTVRHEIGWSSSTNLLQDLGHIFTRESVTWPAPLPATAPLLDPAYQVAGVHNGYGPVLNGHVGRHVDSHAIAGPFLIPRNEVLVAVHTVTMTQHYEYSEDGGRNWVQFINSQFTITRTAGPQAGFLAVLNITKTSVANPAVTATLQVTI